eukprot:TRINITY_DN78705_c0_g1_i1.p1 TRINITY_DN78705_c0_g1~~TRINITY_DN78705_c0_g1_i1.p1  ORF type:complete len:733 (+),score=145.86 TRINITY_DN78705_c0_g1_i1:55-2199(+)
MSQSKLPSYVAPPPETVAKLPSYTAPPPATVTQVPLYSPPPQAAVAQVPSYSAPPQATVAQVQTYSAPAAPAPPEYSAPAPAAVVRVPSYVAPAPTVPSYVAPTPVASQVQPTPVASQVQRAVARVPSFVAAPITTQRIPSFVAAPPAQSAPTVVYTAAAAAPASLVAKPRSNVMMTAYGKVLQEAPTKHPETSGITDSCVLCLPEAACYAMGLKPNIEDKGHDKRLWLGRVWQIRALQLKQYRDLAKKQPQRLSAKARSELDAAMNDPVKRPLLLKVQSRWRGAITRNRARLTCLEILQNHPSSHFGTVLFMHGSGGITYNNVRYLRKMANMGFLCIAPDSMAGGEFRKRDIAKPITSDMKTPYWDDLGLYSTSSEGEYSYSTDAKAVINDPTKWRTLYSNVYRMRRAEMHWILGHLPMSIAKNGIFTMGQSEGAMTVARFDDQRYGAMIRGRIISAFSVEYCYFTPTEEAALYGGSLEVPTLNIIGDADQYFGNIDSVAKSVSEQKDAGGYGADVITGNGFQTMKKQMMRRGLVTVLEGAKHDASETHDNFLRDLLRAFLTAPGMCINIDDLWKHCPYLSKKLEVVERDTEGGGERVLCKVGKMDFPATMPHARELLYRHVGHLRTKDERRQKEIDNACQEAHAIKQKADERTQKLLETFKAKPFEYVEAGKTAYCHAKGPTDMPRKAKSGFLDQGDTSVTFIDAQDATIVA